MTTRWLIAPVAAMAAATVLLGGSSASSARTGAPADTLVLTVRTLGSTLEFVPSRLSARAGSVVRLRLVNEGTLPHNVVLPKDEDDIDVLGVASYAAGATGFIPLEHKAKLHWYTALASPGETVAITFVMPPPGEYRFFCLFPGHYNMMLGTLRALR